MNVQTTAQCNVRDISNGQAEYYDQPFQRQLTGRVMQTNSDSWSLENVWQKRPNNFVVDPLIM